MSHLADSKSSLRIANLIGAICIVQVAICLKHGSTASSLYAGQVTEPSSAAAPGTPTDETPSRAQPSVLWRVRFTLHDPVREPGSRDQESAVHSPEPARQPRPSATLSPRPSTADSSASIPRTTLGRILVEAADGGILLEDRGGRLWNITPDTLIDRQQTDQDFSYYTHEELSADLATELGNSCQIISTEHYVIATTGNRACALWCGESLERFQRAFLRYWRTVGLDVVPPAAPLPVIIHRSRAEYADAVQSERVPALATAHGYYSTRTNQVILVDFAADRAGSPTPRTPADVQRLISLEPSPASTLAHEAAHQLAFNCGLHTRYADNPVWLTEGIAMLFEIPDLTSRNGWRTIARINRPRLNRLRLAEDVLRADPRGLRVPDTELATPDSSLESLIGDDERFRNPESAETAYAQAWALTSFLLKTRQRQFVHYVRTCSGNTHFAWKTRTERLDQFEKSFDAAPRQLEREFWSYISRLR